MSLSSRSGAVFGSLSTAVMKAGLCVSLGHQTTALQTGGLDQRQCVCVSHSSGAWKSEMQVLAALIWPEASACLAHGCLSSPRVSAPSSPPLTGAPVLWAQGPPTSRPRSNLIIASKTLSPDMLTFRGTGGLGLGHVNQGHDPALDWRPKEEMGPELSSEG